MREQRMIWFAIVMSTIIYFVIAYTMAPAPPRSFDESARNSVAFYLLALAMFVAAMVVPKRLVSAPPRQKMVITLSLFEACAIFGLVAAFIQQDWRLYIAPWILALIGMMSAFPREEVTTSRFV